MVMLSVVLSACALPGSTRRPNPLIVDQVVLDELRTRVRRDDPGLRDAVRALRSEAERALSAGPFSVVHKTRPPPGGDRHDYLSYGPYWWPDPDQPDGLPYIRRDGVVNPEARGPDSDRARLGDLVATVETLSLAWFYLGDGRYVARAGYLLRVWFLDSETRMNPHLRYGQAIPGRVDGRGIGIIDTVDLLRLLDAVALIRTSPGWSTSDEKRLESWFASYTDWLLHDANGREEAGEHNNHGTWYDAQLAGYALFTRQPDLARRTLSQVHARRIEPHIEADGSQPYELERTRAISYSLYNLSALFTCARLGAHVGIDMWPMEGADGGGLRDALDFLIPIIRHPETSPNQQISPLPVGRTYSILRTASRVWPDGPYAALADSIAGEDVSFRDLLTN